MTITTTINKTTLPTGYTLRPAHMSDLEACVELFNFCAQEMFGTDDSSQSDIESEWTSPSLVLENNMRVVESPQGQIVGYIEVWDTHSVPVHPWVWWRVHPNHDIQTIGMALLEWADQRAQQVIEKCPPDVRLSYRTGVKTGHAPYEQVVEKCGLQPFRHSWTMMIHFDSAPTPPQLPEGISIRTYHHPQDLEATYHAVHESFRDHFGFVDEPLEEGLKRWKHFVESDDKFDATLWFLAVDDATGEVAAISLCRGDVFNDTNIGWVNTLGVLRSHRKRGLGLAILQHSFYELWKRGKQKVGLGVDASSLTGATRLYEKAGMHVDRQITMYEKEMRPGVEISTTSVSE